MLKFWKRLNELYGWLIIAVFGCIMIIGAWQIYDNYYLFHHTIDESVLRYKPDPSDPTASDDSPISDEMVGWLTIDGTNIDYPVMQGNDNIRFLNTDPFGNYSMTGSIFLDSRCSPDFSDGFSVIYGHHMDYGKMFGALDDFMDEAYLRSHETGTLMIGRNAEKVCKLRVFASARTDAREKTVFDLDQDGIRQYIHNKAEVLTAESSERIIALSTCTDSDTVTRTVVFCYIYE